MSKKIIEIVGDSSQLQIKTNFYRTLDQPLGNRIYPMYIEFDINGKHYIIYFIRMSNTVYLEVDDLVIDSEPIGGADDLVSIQLPTTFFKYVNILLSRNEVV